MTTRAEIADALSRVIVDYDGAPYPIDGQPSRPAVLALWQAFPDWQFATWLGRCVMERTWQVYVIMPGADPASWAEASDAALDVVRDELLKLGSVTRVEPIALVAADQGITLPALNFTLITSN
jgi:hypothetical protein